MNDEKRNTLINEYNNLLREYMRIPQEQINRWVKDLIFSQTRFTSEVIVNYHCDGLFRARTHNRLDGSDKTLFTCESQFWNPPAEICKLGRCNDVNESLFYCSIELSTSIIETKPIKGEFITVAKFQIKNPEKYNGARVRLIGVKTLSKLYPIKDVLGEDYERDAEGLELDETLDELFHKRISPETEKLYRLSVAVTKSMLTTLYDREQQVYVEMHGVLYPSIERNRKHFNMVFRPNHVRYHYAIGELRTFEVIENNDTIIILKERRIGKLKPTIRSDPFDYFGISWKNSNDEIITINK